MRGDRDPESGTSKPHLHTFFAMGSGEVIAFFDIEGIERPQRDHLPTWVRHFAMSVDSHDELMAWRQRLLAHDVLAINWNLRTDAGKEYNPLLQPGIEAWWLAWAAAEKG